MNEKAKLLNPPFSVADAEHPKFRYTGDELYLSFSMIEPEEKHHHFKLCFNAAGVLEAIATDMVLEAQQST